MSLEIFLMEKKNIGENIKALNYSWELSFQFLVFLIATYCDFYLKAYIYISWDTL